MRFDLAQTDELLATTRAVRKRLDLEKPVPRRLVLDCIALSQQAPSGSNSQGWRWLVVDDAAKRRALAELYRKGAEAYLVQAEKGATEAQSKRVFSSALYLMETLAQVPVHVIPCVQGRPPEGTPGAAWSGFFGSIYPAVWSFQLALRARGLGSALTTLHLSQEKAAAEVLGVPESVMQIALLPVAYTKGTDFKRAERPKPETITHWNAWGEQKA
jgi:nitroreductase